MRIDSGNRSTQRQSTTNGAQDEWTTSRLNYATPHKCRNLLENLITCYLV
jgi:hypothetical protein